MYIRVLAAIVNWHLMRSKIMNYRKIGPTSPDKVKGKLVKYRKGHCISIDCKNGKFLAAFISEKFNKYYDLTFIEYCEAVNPTIKDFSKGRFFGKLVGTPDGYVIGLQKQLLECLYIDANNQIKKVGEIDLIDSIQIGGYGYMDSVEELISYYFDDIDLRKQKTNNVQKNPNLRQNGDRLIEMKAIIKHQLPLT